MSQGQTNAHEDLDSQLPEELRSTLGMLRPVRVVSEGDVPEGSTQTEQQKSPNPLSEEAQMSQTTNAAPAVLTAEQIKAIATQAVAEAKTAENRDLAIASTVEKHVNTANEAHKALASVQASLSTESAKVTTLTGELDKATKAVATAEEAKKAAETLAADTKAKLDKAEADLKAANAQITKAVADKTIADRTAAIAALATKPEKFALKAIAANEDGTLKMSDADFADAIADFAALAPKKTDEQLAAEKADAAGKPPFPPKKKDGEEETDDEKKKGDKKAPPFAKAKASTDGETETETEEAPAAPDFSSLALYQQATAAVVNGMPAPSAKGTGSYAKAFGCE